MCSCSLFFFHCRSFFTLVAASISQSVVPTAIKSSYFLLAKLVSINCFYLSRQLFPAIHISVDIKIQSNKIPVFAVVVAFFFFLKVQPCDLPPKRAVLDMRNFTPAYMKGWTYVRTIFAEPKLLGCIDNQISYPRCFASRSLRARGHRYKYTSITQ